MSEYWFRFRAVVPRGEGKYDTVCGVINADDYTSAANKIERYYGKDIERIELLETITDSGGILEFPPDEEHVLDKIAEDWRW